METTEVTPILKCGDPDVPNNYCPISLLPIVSKITERLVHGQLMEYLITNNKLVVHQSGNRKLHWTEKQLCCTLRISYSRLWIARKSPSWSYQICLKHLTVFNTISCYPSYKISTFPRVRQIGFRVTFLTDNSAFELVMQFLKYSHSSSDFRKVLFQAQFCLQSTLTTSFLFLNVVYLTPLSMIANCICPSHLANSVTTSISALNEDLMRISQWCCKNSLLINPGKTKVLAVAWSTTTFAETVIIQYNTI